MHQERVDEGGREGTTVETLAVRLGSVVGNICRIEWELHHRLAEFQAPQSLVRPAGPGRSGTVPASREDREADDSQAP